MFFSRTYKLLKTKVQHLNNLVPVSEQSKLIMYQQINHLSLLADIHLNQGQFFFFFFFFFFFLIAASTHTALL